MKILKIYASVWVLMLTVGGLAYLGGLLNSRTILILGASCVGLLLMGIVGVIPSTMIVDSSPRDR